MRSSIPLPRPLVCRLKLELPRRGHALGIIAIRPLFQHVADGRKRGSATGSVDDEESEVRRSR